MEKREKQIHDSLKSQNNYEKSEEQGLNNPCNRNYGDADNMATKKYFKPAPSCSSGTRSINNDVDAWLNIGGKAFFVKINGISYMTSIASVQALLNGEQKGAKLGRIEE